MDLFADEATISVSSGNGGAGCIAFRREKYVPFGGPSGGDGGKGGDIIFVVRRNLRTLSQFKYKKTFKAQNGQPGSSQNKHGRDGEDLFVAVPPGTQIRDAETRELIMDFSAGAAETWIFLKGGRGGKGNAFFKSSTRQAPRFAQSGSAGMDAHIIVELKLIADIGFVGLPNAGKSSLLAALTRAQPRIAPYPFTTKIPQLGVMKVHETDIIIADLPGLIENAHKGVGLGLQFLKHVARTKALAFMVDLSDPQWKDALDILKNELGQYSLELLSRPRIILATKMDIPESREHLEEFCTLNKGEEVHGISVHLAPSLAEVQEVFFQLCIKVESESSAHPESPPLDEGHLPLDN